MSTLRARIVGALGAVAAAAALAPAAAHAERAAGATTANQLVTFDTAAPSTVSVRSISGLASLNERVIGVDTRPATGELFAVTVPIGSVTNAPISVYKLDARTAQATLVGTAAPVVAGAGDYRTGLDFNPVVDRIRVVHNNNENYRLNPNNGTLSGNDPDLTYTAPATGPVVALAYDRNIAPGPPGTVAPPGTRTTLYGIDEGADRLVTQGGIDGLGPGGANGGAIAAVGPLGITLAAGSDAGLDITAGGTAYAVLTPTGGTNRLYTIDLATGAATEVGSVPVTLNSFTILPPDNCPAVDGDDQADLDGDGLGDACDSDDDGDGVLDTTETANGGNPRSADADGDGKGDAADACPGTAASTANGCPAAPAPPAPDRTAPKLTIASLKTKLTYKAFLKGVAFKLTPDEQAGFEIRLLAKGARATVARAGDVVLGERNFGLATGTRSVRLKPIKKLIGRKRKFNVRIEIRAVDTSGNRVTSTRTLKITG